MLDDLSDLQKLADLSYDRIQKVLGEISPEEREVVWAAVAVIKARKSPGDFAEVASGGWWKFAPHLRLINNVLMDACKGGQFICVSVSVRCGKSELGSKFMPAWYLCNNPNNNIILTSYAKDLSRGFSRASRDLIKEFGPTLFDVGLSNESAAADTYMMGGNFRGGMKSTSVGSAVTGFGGDLIIGDDLYKDITQAFSAAYNRDLREWYKSTLRTRLHPNGSIVNILARWANDDFSGWLLEQSKEIADFDQWKEIKLSMRCTDPETDPLGRSLGDPLWPGRYSEQELRAFEATSGPLYWACQYQQQPLVIENTMFDPSDWQYVDHLPPLQTVVRQWDLSAGGERADFLAGALMGIDAEKNIYVIDMVHEKCATAAQVEKVVRGTSVSDRISYPNCLVAIEQTAGAGKAIIEHYRNTVLHDFAIIARTTRGDKVANAAPFAGKQQQRQVFILKEEAIDGGYTNPSWHDEMITECAMFGDYKNDDQVDALSQGFKTLSENSGRRSRFFYKSYR